MRAHIRKTFSCVALTRSGSRHSATIGVCVWIATSGVLPFINQSWAEDSLFRRAKRGKREMNALTDKQNDIIHHKAASPINTKQQLA